MDGKPYSTISRRIRKKIETFTVYFFSIINCDGRKSVFQRSNEASALRALLVSKNMHVPNGNYFYLSVAEERKRQCPLRFGIESLGIGDFPLP